MRDNIVEKIKLKGWFLVPVDPYAPPCRQQDDIFRGEVAYSLEPGKRYVVVPAVKKSSRKNAVYKSFIEGNFPRIKHKEKIIPFFQLHTENDGACVLGETPVNAVFITYDELGKDVDTMNNFLKNYVAN